MDFSGTISGQKEASRRALIQGAIVGIAGLAGCTTTATDGEQAVSYLKDEQNDEDDIQVDTLDGKTDGDGGDGTDPDGGVDRTDAVVSQLDLTERNGRVTIRLGPYERVVRDPNGESTGESAWRVDGKRAARGGVSLRARDDDTIQLTLQNPTRIPYSLSIRSGSPDGRRVTADSYGITVYAGGVETLVVDELTQGEYAYTVETPTRPIEALAGKLLVDSKPTDDESDTTDPERESEKT